MNRKTVLALALIWVSTAAQAKPEEQYIALNIGTAKYSNATLAGSAYPDPFSLDIIYGYRVLPNLAAEFGCTQFGNSVTEGTVRGVATKGNILASSTHAAAVGYFPISPSFEVFGKAGFTFNISQLNLTSANSSSVSGASGTSLYYGIGASYKLDEALSIQTQYENFGSFGQFASTSNELTATVISLGIVHSW